MRTTEALLPAAVVAHQLVAGRAVAAGVALQGFAFLRVICALQVFPRAETPDIIGGAEPAGQNPLAHGPHNASFAEQVQSNLHTLQMLRMDFPHSVQLRVIMDDGHDIERKNCTDQLFAVITARLEHAATLAAEGQGRGVPAKASVQLVAEI